MMNDRGSLADESWARVFAAYGLGVLAVVFLTIIGVLFGLVGDDGLITAPMIGGGGAVLMVAVWKWQVSRRQKRVAVERPALVLVATSGARNTTRTFDQSGRVLTSSAVAAAACIVILPLVGNPAPLRETSTRSRSCISPHVVS
jgi:hypothetical protein